MEPVVLAKSYYELSRNEINLNIKLRDQTLFVYLGAMGVIFGMGLGNEGNLNILLLMPYIAAGVSIIVYLHDHIMGSITAYTMNTLDNFLTTGRTKVPQWDNSEEFEEYRKKLYPWRFVGQTLIIGIPAIVALYVNRIEISGSFNLIQFLWWFGILLTVFSLSILFYSWRKRIELFKKTND